MNVTMAFAIHLTVARSSAGMATANAARRLFIANHAVIDHSVSFADEA
jgi:hypothetical protein